MKNAKNIDSTVGMSRQQLKELKRRQKTPPKKKDMSINVIQNVRPW